MDEQYAIYVCGDRYHPPMIALGRLFASQGETAANYLRRKLDTPQDDRMVVLIVRVFMFMEVDRTSDVAGNTELLRLLERNVNGLEDGDLKDLGLQALGILKSARVSR